MTVYKLPHIAEAFAIVRAVDGFVDDDTFWEIVYCYCKRFRRPFSLLHHVRTIVRANDSQLEADVIAGKVGIHRAINMLKRRPRRLSATVLPFPSPVLH